MAGPAKTGRSRPGGLEACSAPHTTPGSRMSSEQQSLATELLRPLTTPLLLHGTQHHDFFGDAYLVDHRVRTMCMEGNVPSVLWQEAGRTASPSIFLWLD